LEYAESRSEGKVDNRAIWRLIYHVIGMFCLLMVSLSSAVANEQLEFPKSIEDKCEALTKRQAVLNEDPFILWESHSKLLHLCAPSAIKNEQSILSALGNNSVDLDEFLKSRRKSENTDIDNPIHLAVAKVKKGQKLSALSSEAYKSTDGQPIIFGTSIDKKTNITDEEGYVFIPNPEKKIKKGCFLGLFSDGYFSIPKTENNLKWSCVFLERPVVHFNLISIQHPSFSIANTQVIEGGDLEFVVTKEGNQSLQASLAYEIVSGSALKDNDYTATSLVNRIEFDADEVSKSIIIQTIDDSSYEADEQLSVRIFNPINARIKNPLAEGVIKNNDFKTVLDIEGDETNEGGTLNFQVTRTGNTQTAFSINYEADQMTATEGDFVMPSGQIHFAANESVKFIPVITKNDELDEKQEKMKLKLLVAPDIQFINADAIGTINNVRLQDCGDGSVVTDFKNCPGQIETCPDGSSVNNAVNCSLKESGPFSLSDAQADVGEPLEFIISRTEPLDVPVTIKYETRDVTAIAGTDYYRASGEVRFEKDDLTKTIEISTIKTDSSMDKTIALKVSSESGTQFANDMTEGEGIILGLCTQKPELTKVSFPTVDGERHIQFEGKACPGHFVSFGANEAFEKLHQLKVKEDGNFNLSTNRTDFHPDASYLNIHVASLDYELDDPKPKNLPDKLVFGKSKGVIPATDDCRAFEIGTIPDELGTEKVDYLIINYHGLTVVNGECALEISGEAKAYESAIINYAYNPRGSFTVNADKNGKFYSTVVIPALANVSLEALKIDLNIESADGTKTGEVKLPQDWSLSSLAKFLEIFYDFGFVTSQNDSPFNEYDLIKIEQVRNRIDNPFFFHPPTLDDDVVTSIRNAIDTHQEVIANPSLKPILHDRLKNLTDKELTQKNISTVTFKLNALVHPKKPQKKLFQFNSAENFPATDLLEMQQFNGKLVPFNTEDEFNENLQLEPTAEMTFKICSVDSNYICEGRNKASVKLGVKLETQKVPFNWGEFGGVIVAIIGTLAALIAIYEFLIRRRQEFNKVRSPEEILLLEVFSKALNKYKFNRSVIASAQETLKIDYGVFGDSKQSAKLQSYIRNSKMQDPLPFVQSILSSTRKTCLIRTHDQILGTGFLVGDNEILTNYHVYSKADNHEEIFAFFDYVKDSAGMLSNNSIKIKIDRSNIPLVSEVSSGTEFDEEPDKLDYALLKLERNIGEEVIMYADGTSSKRGFYKLGPDVVDLNENDDVFIFHHPDGDPIKCSPGQIEQYNGAALGARSRYDASTLNGSSGGAVLNDNFELAALHHATGPGENPEFNQGIPAHLIYLDLKRQREIRRA